MDDVLAVGGRLVRGAVAWPSETNQSFLFGVYEVMLFVAVNCCRLHSLLSSSFNAHVYIRTYLSAGQSKDGIHFHTHFLSSASVSFGRFQNTHVSEASRRPSHSFLEIVYNTRHLITTIYNCFTTQDRPGGL